MSRKRTNTKSILTAFAIGGGLLTFAWLNGLPHASRAADDPLLNYAMYSIRQTTGELVRYDLSGGSRALLGTVRLGDGTVLTGIGASAYKPGFANLYTFWQDPSDALTKIVYVSLESSNGAIVGADLGSQPITSAVATTAVEYLAPPADEPTPPSVSASHEVYAVQGVYPYQAPADVITLNPTASDALLLAGNSKLTLNGTSVQVNSSDAANALHCKGGGIYFVSGGEINVAGGSRFDGAATYTGTLTNGADAITDPLASLPTPKWDPTDDKGGLDLKSGTHTVTPGYYSGGIAISTTAVVDFEPGEYVLGGAGLTVSGSATVTAKHVLFYIDSGVLLLQGNGKTTITPGYTGDYAGISVFQARTNTSTAKVTGTSTLNIAGTLYVPGGMIEANGTGDGIGNQLIADKILIRGGANLTINAATWGRFINVNPVSGAATTIMPLARVYDGLAATAADRFHATLGKELWEIDPVAQTETLIGPIDESDASALECLGAMLVGFSKASSSLFLIDPDTGATLGLPMSIGISDLGTMAFVRSADEPSSEASFD